MRGGSVRALVRRVELGGQAGLLVQPLHGPLQRGKTMHRSSKERREKISRRWKRALLAAAIAASFATGSFLVGDETAPAKKKLPTRAIAPTAVSREGSASIAAEGTSSRKTTPASTTTRLLGAKASPFRTVAIEAIPAEEKE